ncbi:MAG: FAD-binding protein [Anaerolineales bacterium]|nr:FAD-binding protein [Anaerolineales bacterium]
MENKAFLERLQEIYPEDRLLTKKGQLVAYESDSLTSYQVQPIAVVIPENQPEVINTVKTCYEFEIPFVARGSGTSLSGGSLPI